MPVIWANSCARAGGWRRGSLPHRCASCGRSSAAGPRWWCWAAVAGPRSTRRWGGWGSRWQRTTRSGLLACGCWMTSRCPRCTWKRVSSLRALVEARTAELRELGATIQRRLGAHAGCPTIPLLRGVGAVPVAEMGEVTSLAQDAAPGSSAGLAPPHREPDRSAHQGRITKQGSRLVSWATGEAPQRLGGDFHLGECWAGCGRGASGASPGWRWPGRRERLDAGRAARSSRPTGEPLGSPGASVAALCGARVV